MGLSSFKSFLNGPLRGAILWAYLPTLVLIGVMGMAARATDVSVQQLTRDLAATAQVPAYTGVLSTVGLLMWSATAAVCFLTASVLYHSGRGLAPWRFLLNAGGLTVILLLDDAFMVHEQAPQLFGVSNKVVIATLGALAVAVFAAHIAVIRTTSVVLLVAGVGFLGLSVATDTLHDFGLLRVVGLQSPGSRYLLEDGLKLLGIVGWLAYFGHTSFQWMMPSPARHDPGSDTLGDDRPPARATSQGGAVEVG